MNPFGFRTRRSRLRDLSSFGSNPGALGAKMHVPAGLPEGAPLVVALHGGSQSAEDYDEGSAWSRYADRHGFAMLFPQQSPWNNPASCFNWYGSGDNQRASGEALSIRQMVEAMATGHGIDRSRVFITGLSAGGAMAVVMMATYPETFAGGAVIAGLPYGCANGMFQAMDRMHGLGGLDARELEAIVRGASKHDGPWPTISIWHGSADRTVAESNVASMVLQWCALHRTDRMPSRCDVVDGYPRRVWSDASGREVVEAYSITGMGHGTPLDTQGIDGFGISGAFMLDAHISSTRHIMRFWSLTSLPAPILSNPV